VRKAALVLAFAAGREPSQIKANHPYWDVTFDYYKGDSITIEFGGRVFVDAITGDKVN
jgi:hypothetical protein